MKTTVYVKMDAQDQLLLSEGVCRQLGIVTYHPSIEPPAVPDRNSDVEALVPTVRVRLVQSLRLPANQGAVVPVCCDSEGGMAKLQSPLLVEPVPELGSLVVESAVVSPPRDGLTQMVVWNKSGFTQQLSKGAVLGVVDNAEVLDAPSCEQDTEPVTVSRLDSSAQESRKKKLLEMLKLADLPPDELQQLKDFLVSVHDVFSVSEGERGETDIVQLEIDTGDAQPQKQAPRRIPFILRQEVTPVCGFVVLVMRAHVCSRAPLHCTACMYMYM